MKTFYQFIVEKFFAGMPGPDGYAEVFVDPTDDELREVTFEDPQYEAAGILVGTKLYVWNRAFANHSEVKHLLNISSDPHWLPVYILYDWRHKKVTVQISRWSMELDRRHPQTPEQFKQNEWRVIHCPALKRLGTVIYKR